MPEYLAPGIFVEEIDSGSKPIEGVGVNTAAFVGYAKSGEFNKPTFITSWSDFCRIYGEDDSNVYRALSEETGLSVKELVQAKRTARKGLLQFTQETVDKQGRELRSAGKLDGKAGNWSEFVKKYSISLSSSPFMEGSYLAYALRGFFDNGGGRAYIVRVARPDDMDTYNYTSSGGQAALGGGTPATLTHDGYSFKALDAGERGNNIKIEVNHVGDDGFTVRVTMGSKSESIGTAKDPLTPDTAASTINDRSKMVEVATASATRPSVGEFFLSGGSAPSSTSLATLPISKELASVIPDDFVGNEADRSGFSGLEELEDVNMVAVPDLMAGVYRRETIPGSDQSVEVVNLDERKKEQILNLQSMLISWCERMGDRMAILDPLPGLNPQEMRDTTMGAPFSSDRGQAAIYYPWVKVLDQVNPQSKSSVYCPPAGHIAGVWARVGSERGVHKAPANESLRGAVALEWNVSKREQEILNPNGINCIRSFPGTGIRIWGARTLATVGNPSWKYVNVRRIFNYIEKSIERGTQWVVFEPNDYDLWQRVRRNVSAFLTVCWREGMLFGRTPEEAFFVKCDRETNPQETVDLGRLYCEIGVNPVKPAEFVIFRIGQWSGGSETNE